MALAGGTGAFFLGRRASGSVRYCVPSPEKSDLAPFGHDQNFSNYAAIPEKTVNGFPPGFRSLVSVIDEETQVIRRVFVPGLIHAGAFSGDRVLLVSRGEPSIFLALDAKTLEIAAARTPPPGFVFGGHLTPISESDIFALTLNTTEIGGYDSVGFFHSRDLSERNRFSSYGFQAHDLVLSLDEKQIVVGHYGSNFKSGPFRGLRSPLYSAKNLEAAGGSNDAFFPASVTRLDSKTGALLERVSHRQNGPQGHLSIGNTDQIFLTKNPPLLMDRGDAKKNLAFSEGITNKLVIGNFPVLAQISGTTVVSDPENRQFLLLEGQTGRLLWGSFESPDDVHHVELRPLPGLMMAHGIHFHPDGTHYVVSGEKGFATFTRRTHVFVPERSFLADIADHSHFCIG